jgi:predicted RNase H-like HicB family nuclease
MSKQNEYTAVIQQDDGWYIGWIKEVPGANAQERTLEELRVSLREVLEEILKFNRIDAMEFVGDDYFEEPIVVAV